MAKILMPPEIHDLNGLLELVLHPEKGIAYLQQLQAVRDAIIAALGTLETKVQADELVDRASSRMKEALEAASLAHDLENETKVKCAAMLDEARQTVAGHEQTMGLALEQLAKDQAAMTKQEAHANKALAEAAQESMFNRNFQATLDHRKRELDEREARLAKVKVAMGEAGV